MGDKRKMTELEYEKQLGLKDMEIKDKEVRIADLEKENAELKADYKVLSCSVGDFGELQDKLEEEQRKNNGLEEQLTKAKEIIRDFISVAIDYIDPIDKNYSLIADSEQFLSEVEK